MKGVEFGLRHASREAQLARTDASRLMHSRLPFYSPTKVRGHLVFFIEEAGEVVALCNCEPSSCGEVLTLVGFGVDANHRDKGYCSQLVRGLAEFMRNGGYRVLSVTRYTQAGLSRLRPCLWRHLQGIEVLDDGIPLAA